MATSALQPISILVFDLDGTLADTLEDITASVNHALALLGRTPLPSDTVRRYIGSGIENLMERSLGGQDARLAEAVTHYKEHHRAHFADQTRLYPGTREVLEQFGRIPLAVISNKSTEFVKPLLDKLGIARFFCRVIGADSGLPLKPAPDAIVKLLGDFGVPGNRAVIIGDGATDITAGRRAGIITCAVTYGYRSEEELRRELPDHVIHGLSDLLRLFVPDASPGGRAPE